jgi:hypothetical protein
MTVAGGLGHVFESICHPGEPGIIPCPSEKLDADWLSVTVNSRGKCDRRNTIRRTGRVAAAEAGPCATSVVHTDFTQQTRIDDSINTPRLSAPAVSIHVFTMD